MSRRRRTQLAPGTEAPRVTEKAGTPVDMSLGKRVGHSGHRTALTFTLTPWDVPERIHLECASKILDQLPDVPRSAARERDLLIGTNVRRKRAVARSCAVRTRPPRGADPFRLTVRVTPNATTAAPE